MDSITVKAPAKVNLFLKVLGKRKDSYHNILTIFERISLADTIKISKIPKGIIVKSDKPITLDAKDNLCFKAAEAILRRGKVRSGVKIEIKKRIPVASGLGGGSSDAASTIIGINRLFRLRLDGKALLSIGKRLGADLPFFLLDTPFAIGRGRGDMLEVVKSKAKFWHLIIKAGSKTATRDIYGAFDTERAGTPKRLTLQRGDVKMFSLSKLRMDYAGAESMLHNDLERAVSLKKGVISRILKSLAQLLGKKVMISGSGPSLFCLYRTRKEAIKASGLVLKSVPKRERSDWQIFVADTCS
ncbi:MAG: 4-(cytidine 5'-diphospho)-2-C-methyl-D-erythritol kinase [Candidatus Omnitrophica bacterium]|nr:4-(cytidine 5'-diphospho)-2-C-methyl-D-erythritol kinase [Candidatus Omnitrophota bacterium]